MANPVRGDDDVLALLNEMTGSGPSFPGNNDNSNNDDRGGDTVATSSAEDDTRNNPTSFATALAAAHRLSPPNNPRVEIIRHRCHEKFKASFYDVFRSCCATTPDNNNPGSEKNQCLKSIIHPIWNSMPPHGIWERLQFSLKTLEADCVREAIEAIQGDATNNDESGSERYVPPWCRHHKNDGEQLLQQLLCPTVHQIHAWTIAGRYNGTLWEPLLPVPFISASSGTDYTAELQQINQKYRRGTLSLFQEEIKFQFRRSFKQRGAKGKDQAPLSIDKLFASFKDFDEAASSNQGSSSNDGDAAQNKIHKSEKGKKKPRGSGRENDRHANDEGIPHNKEEYILQTIFQSHPFQKLTQKLSKRFHYLATDSYSTFLYELKKCSNRLIFEEEQGRQLSIGRKQQRKRKKSGSGGNGTMPKITFVETGDDDGKFGGSNDANANRDGQVMVTFAGISLRINEMHKSKLHSLFQRTLYNVLGRRDERYERYLQLFPKLLFTALLRYDALEGAGLQSAIPPTVFRFLRRRFGCEFECFASPFNCWMENESRRGRGGLVGGNYGSAFGDTDAVFGSAGSFFGTDFLKMAKETVGGCCFQANPPFGSEFIERMCRRMHHFLMVSNNGDDDVPLMFVIIVPAWTESSGWKTLSSSPHLTKHVLLSQKDDVHYYSEGTQHRRAMEENGSHRIASFDTSVFLLQNNAATKRWPLFDDADQGILKAAFAMNYSDNDNGDNDVFGGDSARAGNVERSLPAPQSQKQHRKINSKTSVKQKKKKNQPDDKSKGSSKKKKLMTGGNDEMSILASMGILDSGPSKDGADISKGENKEQNVDNDAPKGKLNLATGPKGSTSSKKRKKRRRK